MSRGRTATKCLKSILLLVCSLLPCAAAQERGRFGVGFSAGLPRPLAAISLKVDVTDAAALEAIVGPAGSLSTYGLKAAYSFVLEPGYRVYAFGVGLLGPEGFAEAPQTLLTVGGGVGLEFSYLTLYGGDPARVPPLWANLDLGLANRGLLNEGLSIYFSSSFSFRF